MSLFYVDPASNNQTQQSIEPLGLLHGEPMKIAMFQKKDETTGARQLKPTTDNKRQNKALLQTWDICSQAHKCPTKVQYNM